MRYDPPTHQVADPEDADREDAQERAVNEDAVYEEAAGDTRPDAPTLTEARLASPDDQPEDTDEPAQHDGGEPRAVGVASVPDEADREAVERAAYAQDAVEPEEFREYVAEREAAEDRAEARES